MTERERIKNQIFELENALATGAMSISSSGPTGTRTITYRSIDEMRRILAQLKAQIGDLTGPDQGNRFYFSRTRRGYRR